MPEDVMCGGVRRLREPFRPSANFAPKTGGKYAHLRMQGHNGW